MAVLYRLILLLILVLAGLGAYYYGRSLWVPLYYKLKGQRTVEDVARDYGPKAEPRIREHFRKAGAGYPPAALTMLAFKDEKQLEVWAKNGTAWTFIAGYPILGASGRMGPKLREGDMQVPEGLYRIDGLNPNSSYHLSMKVDYPNDFDRRQAEKEGRTDLGGDIFIHGKKASIGCLAMGDSAIEELFLLVHRVGMERVEVILAPHDLRKLPTPKLTEPSWSPELYGILCARLKEFTR